MSGDSVTRAERLVALRAREVDVAHGALADATRAREAAEEAATLAEASWAVRVRAEATRTRGLTGEIIEMHAFIRALRQRADHADLALTRARTEERQALSRLLAARSNLRKLELWRDGLKSSASAVLARQERLAADEHASRGSRRTA